MTFYVGQKVVCVDDADASLPGIPNELVKGRIYTVARTGLIHPFDPKNLPCIMLEEFSQNYLYRYGLWAHRFRPVVDRKTEVSFTIGADPSTEQYDNRRVLTPSDNRRVPATDKVV